MIAASSRRVAVGVGAGLTALILAYIAHIHGRPVTAALVAVFGAVCVGAMLGFKAGAVAGIVASITYNLLFTDPVLRFSLSSIDDLVPVIALNLSAIGSALVAGRLRDRAVAAETSSRQVNELLRFSEDLQLAMSISEVEEVAGEYFDAVGGDLRLFVDFAGELRPAGERSAGHEIAYTLWSSDASQMVLGQQHGTILTSGDRRLGALVITWDGPIMPNKWLDLFAPLIALAVERCQLAEQLRDTDLIKKSEHFKTALLSSVSHDLRTPLAAISAASSSLAGFGRQLDEAAKRDLLEMIVEQCNRLDRLTTNLLNLGRIEGGLDVDAMPVIDAIEVLGSALSRVRADTVLKTFDRDFKVKSALIRADPALLEQVFLNVLGNAVVHTPDDSTIKVTAEAQEGKLVVAVQDNGAGIPAAERERVFARFYQLRRTRKMVGGSGLGLSIARGFTEIIGGRIAAVDPQGSSRGARIEVTVPMMERAA